MKRAKSRIPEVSPATAVTVLLQGAAARIPTAMPQMTGLLVYREDNDIISVWDNGEWVPLNQAGFSLRFRCDFPAISPGNWALIHGPRLDLTAGNTFVNLTPQLLHMAIHMASIVPPQPCVQPHQDVTDRVADQEFADVRADVDAYVCDLAAAPTLH